MRPERREAGNKEVMDRLPWSRNRVMPAGLRFAAASVGCDGTTLESSVRVYNNCGKGF